MSANDGTQTAPVATSTKAIALAEKGPGKVYACTETWTEPLVVKADVPPHGGFDCEKGLGLSSRREQEAKWHRRAWRRGCADFGLGACVETGEPREREMNKRAGRLLSVVSALALGCATGILAIGGCGGAPWPSDGKLPERVLDKLEACGRKGPTPLQETNYDLTFTVHVAEDETEARVDDVMLTSSTLHIDDVEACMRDALYGMRTPLKALALRRRTLSPDPPFSPDSRTLLGQSETVLLFQLAALFVMGYATYHVIVHVLLDKPRPKHRPHPATSATEEPPAPAPVASATAEPTATTVPTAVPAPAVKSCTDMYVDCREKGPPCDRKLGGKTMCAYCQDNCLAEEPYKFKQCTECGFK